MHAIQACSNRHVETVVGLLDFTQHFVRQDANYKWRPGEQRQEQEDGNFFTTRMPRKSKLQFVTKLLAKMLLYEGGCR